MEKQVLDNAVLIKLAGSLLTALLLSYVMTGGLRRYALANSVMDVPNERSSHRIPTPRGGGLSIVATFLISLFFLVWQDLIGWPLALAVGGAGAFVAVVGFLDDHGHIAASWRLIVHFSAAAWGLAWMGGGPLLDLPFLGAVDLGWLGFGLTLLYLVWLLNLYNFMDGIDGIAGVEAVTVCLSAALLGLSCGLPLITWMLPVILSACVAGFLMWNFPPAKIFMGDAGSGFLGLMLGVLSLIMAKAMPALFWSWVILLGVFVVDATTTLIRRLIRGEKVYEPHRSHAYQYASRRQRAHRPVTLAVGAVNLLWLFPLSLAVARGWLDGVAATLIAYVPLVWLALHFKAGARELQDA